MSKFSNLIQLARLPSNTQGAGKRATKTLVDLHNKHVYQFTRHKFHLAKHAVKDHLRPNAITHHTERVKYHVKKLSEIKKEMDKRGIKHSSWSLSEPAKLPVTPAGKK